MAKTRFFRVAVEGATATDGRTISADMIDQSAVGYKTVAYTARINCEHLRGFSPEPPFNAYGSVVAVKAEDFTLKIDGKDVKRRALYAQPDPNDQMVKTIRSDQKIFTSCEFTPDFAKDRQVRPGRTRHHRQSRVTRHGGAELLRAEADVGWPQDRSRELLFRR